VRFVRGFGQFWYDFIIGDDWKIAAAIVTTILVGALVAWQASTDPAWLPPLLGVALALAFVVSLVIDVRRD
jgi:hypothetical protein